MEEQQTENREKQWKQVATLLGVENAEFLGSLERYIFSFNILPQVINLGFVSLAHKFNSAPTVEVFYEFGKRAVGYGATVHLEGFLESQYREDSRLVIEGIQVTNIPDSAKLVMDFAQTFHDANEFTTNSELLRAWYD